MLSYKSVENLGRAITRYLDDLGFYSIYQTTRTFRKTFIFLCRTRYSVDASFVCEVVVHGHLNTSYKYYNHISIYPIIIKDLEEKGKHYLSERVAAEVYL